MFSVPFAASLDAARKLITDPFGPVSRYGEDMPTEGFVVRLDEIRIPLDAPDGVTDDKWTAASTISIARFIDAQPTFCRFFGQFIDRDGNLVVYATRVYDSANDAAITTVLRGGNSYVDLGRDSIVTVGVA